APGEVLARAGGLARLPEVALVVGGGALEQLEQALAAQALLLRLWVLGLALELDAVALGEQLERALEVDVLDVLDEREDVAGGVAAEAVVDLLLGVDAERRRALIVEGTAPLIACRPGAAQLGV